jgi:uncharacterized cupin superfamily protein
VKYTRIFTGTDNISHFEDVEVDFKAGSGTTQSVPWAVKGGSFGQQPAEYVQDWHPVPRRQFVITLSGEVEIVVSDGETRRFGPGSVFLAEDTTGKGHITRGAGSLRVSFAVPLAD